MDDVETPTTTEVPTPAEVVEAPKTETVEAPAEETKPEAEPTEAKPEETDPYDELEHERFRPVLERRDQRNAATLRQDYQRQYEEATLNWKSTEAHKQLAGIYGNILQKLEDGDAETVGKLVGRPEEAVQPDSES